MNKFFLLLIALFSHALPATHQNKTTVDPALAAGFRAASDPEVRPYGLRRHGTSEDALGAVFTPFVLAALLARHAAVPAGKPDMFHVPAELSESLVYIALRKPGLAPEPERLRGVDYAMALTLEPTALAWDTDGAAAPVWMDDAKRVAQRMRIPELAEFDFVAAFEASKLSQTRFVMLYRSVRTLKEFAAAPLPRVEELRWK